jgi:hypothetical protein
MLSLLSVTRHPPQNERLIYLPRAKQQTVYAHFFLRGLNSTGQTTVFKESLERPDLHSTFSVICHKMLEAKLEADEVQMRYSLLAVGRHAAVLRVREMGKEVTGTEGGTGQTETDRWET